MEECDGMSANSRVLINNFEYLEPETVAEAITILTKYGEEAKVIAGGTDVLVDMKKGRISPKYLIGLNKIPNLAYLVEDASGLHIGARTTFREIEESGLIKEKYPLLLEAASAMGTVQIRNMATIGGNICNALPSADFPPALVALDATIRIACQSGERAMNLEEFPVGIRKTKLECCELLKEVQVKTLPTHSGTAFLKLGKTSEDLATVNTAVRLTLGNDRKCKAARIVVGGGVGPTLFRSRESEALLEGNIPDESLLREAAQAACKKMSCRPTSIRGSPYYKTEVTKVLVMRALTKALERARVG